MSKVLAKGGTGHIGSILMPILILVFICIPNISITNIGGLGVNVLDLIFFTSLFIWITKGFLAPKIKVINSYLLFMIFIVSGFFSAMIGLLHNYPIKDILFDFRAGYLYLPVILIVYCSIKNQKQFNLFLYSIITLSAIICSVAIYNYLIFNRYVAMGYILENLRAPHVSIGNVGGRVRAFYPNLEGNSLGSYLIMVIPLVFVSIKLIKSKLLKTAMIALLFSMIICLLFTYSRGAYLAFAGSMVVLFLLNSKISRRKRHILLTICIFSIFCIAIIRFVPDAQIILSRLKTILLFKQEISIEGRLLNYFTAFNIFLDNLLIGKGLGYVYGGTVVSRHFDSIYFFFLVKTGIIGITAFLVILIIMFRKKKGPSSCHSAEMKELALKKNALLSGIAAFLIHGLFDFILWLPKLALLFWILVGLTLSISKIKVKSINGIY